MEPKLSKQLQDANHYLDAHKIEKLVSEVLNKTVQSKDDNPLVFMIKCLAELTPAEVLEKNGILIEEFK